jgi:hypothetical protein
MNSNHKNGGNKTPFEDDLGKISQAYGQITPEEPPELLDQAILNSAHRAVEKQSHWMQFGWLHGLTTAAVVVLAISIILHQSEPVPVFEDDMLSNTPLQAPLQEAPKKESGDPVMESRREMRLRTEPLDKDSAEKGLVAEEVKFHQAEVMADAPQAGAALKQASPASTSEPDKSDLRAEAMTEPEAAYEPGAEDELAAIINLKEAGDESWREALEQFQQRYPDYPLPEGLKD